MQLSSSLSTRLQYQHKSLVDIIDGLTEEQVRRPIHAGKWSIFENIVHLQTYQHTFIERVKLILEGNNPVIEKYTAEADPLFLDNCLKSFREIMHDYIAIRKELAARYVFESTRSLTEIAELLGFTAPSSFSRWYQSQFGCSAKESRAKVQQASTPPESA